MRTYIQAMCLAAVACTLQAAPVKWYLSQVTFSDGGRAVGSFVYDANAVSGSKFTQINIQTTPAPSTPAGSSAIGAVLLGEHAHHESRRAISALRSACGCHSFLNFRKLLSPGCQRFHCVDFAVHRHGRKHQAAIDGAIGASPSVVHQHHYRARAALAFRAALLRSRQALIANIVEQSGLDGSSVERSGATVQEEFRHFIDSGSRFQFRRRWTRR